MGVNDCNELSFIRDDDDYYLAASTKVTLPTATDVTVAWSVWVSDGQNKTPFARDTCVLPRNTVLDRGLVPPGRGDLGVEAHSLQ